MLPLIKMLLQELNLSRNRLPAQGFADFAEALPLWEDLRILNLSINKIGNESFKELSQSLTALKKLKELHIKLCRARCDCDPLADSNITDGALEVAMQLVKLPVFRKLDIADNRIPLTYTALMMMQLVKAQALEELSLGGNDFDPRMFVAFQQEVQKFPSLCTLHATHGMASSVLDDDAFNGDCVLSDMLSSVSMSGSTHLARSFFQGMPFAHLHVVQHLDISGTTLPMVRMLGEALEQMKELQSLNISCIKAVDGGSLGSALTRLTKLTRLEAMRAFRKTHGPLLPFLSRLEKLQHVDLSSRGEKGGSLAGLSSLRYLCLARSDLQGSHAEALAMSLPEARALRHLDVSTSNCSVTGLCQVLLGVAELPVEHLNISHIATTRGKAKTALAELDELAGVSLSLCTQLQDLVWHSAPAPALVNIGLQLTMLTSLTRIDLQGANIGQSLKCWDIAWLGLLAGTLRSLSLKNTGLFGANVISSEVEWVDERLQEHVFPTLGALTRLHSLNLGYNSCKSMSDASSLCLAQEVAKMRSLTTLKLHKCDLRSFVVDLFAIRAIPQLLSLKVLGLEDNWEVGTASMQLLDIGLKGVLGLERLYLSSDGAACANAVSSDMGNIVRRALGGRCDCSKCDRRVAI
jgi:hypothetical protein